VLKQHLMFETFGFFSLEKIFKKQKYVYIAQNEILTDIVIGYSISSTCIEGY